MTKAAQLKKAMRTRRLVRFSRRYDKSNTHGYVKAVGPEFFLLLLIDDTIRFNGFECFRISDITGLRTDPYSSFVETVLKKRKLKKPSTPRINILSTKRLLESGSKAFPLITIHTERRDPDVCHIGRVTDIDKTYLSFLEIRPGAVWETQMTRYKLRDITRVSFGGGYEDALFIVGGEPKAG